MSQLERHLTVHEVAKVLNVSAETVRILARTKALKSKRVGNGPRSRYRFPESYVAEYCALMNRGGQ